MILLLACITPAVVSTDTPADTSTDTPPDADDTGTPSDTDFTGTAADCGLAADLDDVWLWEGDEVAYTLDCTGDVPVEALTISPVSLPEAAVFDAAARTVTWQTGPADAGQIDMVFSVRAEGDTIPSTATVTVWLADNPELPDAEPPDPLTYTAEWGLPVLFLSVDGAMSQSDQDAVVHFGGREYPAEAKIRGASSAYYPKPSYTIELTEDELDLTEIWGETRNHLILLTTFDDNSYVRQKLIYDQWAEMAAFWGEERLTPRTFFAIVYLNDAYAGLYVALDRVDNEFIGQMGFEDTGGLYKAVNHDANFYLTDSGGSAKDTLHDGYEKKEGTPEDDFSELDDLVRFTGSAASSGELIAGLDDRAMSGELMDWFLLVFYSLAEDSAGKNSYLYFDPDTGLARYVPWDFNHAWGQNWYTLRTSPSSLNSYTGNNRIFWAFQDDDAAAEALAARYAAMRADGPLHPDWLTGTVDAYYALITPAAERDWQVWGSAYQSYSGWSSARSGTWTDFEGEQAYLYGWLDDRAALFDANYPP